MTIRDFVSGSAVINFIQLSNFVQATVHVANIRILDHEEEIKILFAEAGDENPAI